MGSLPRRRRSLRRKEGRVMSTTPDKLVERYLKHLDVELDDLPRDRRREIVDEISGHIAEARADLEPRDGSRREEYPRRSRRPSRDRDRCPGAASTSRHRNRGRVSRAAWRSGALIMLLVGGLVLPVIGWIVGVILLLDVEPLEYAGQDHRNDLRSRRAWRLGFLARHLPASSAGGSCGEVGGSAGLQPVR